eukprot:512465_1
MGFVLNDTLISIIKQHPLQLEMSDLSSKQTVLDRLVDELQVTDLKDWRRVSHMLNHLKVNPARIVNTNAFWFRMGFKELVQKMNGKEVLFLNSEIVSIIEHHPLLLKRSSLIDDKYYYTVLDRLIDELAVYQLKRFRELFYLFELDKIKVDGNIKNAVALFNAAQVLQSKFKLIHPDMFNLSWIFRIEIDQKYQIDKHDKSSFIDTEYRLINSNEKQPNILFGYNDSISIVNGQHYKIQITNTRLFGDKRVTLQQILIDREMPDDSFTFRNHLIVEDNIIKLKTHFNSLIELMQRDDKDIKRKSKKLNDYKFVVKEEEKDDRTFVFQTRDSFSITLGMSQKTFPVITHLFVEPLTKEYQCKRIHSILWSQYVLKQNCPLNVNEMIHVNRFMGNDHIQIYCSQSIIIGKLGGIIHRNNKLGGIIQLVSSKDIVIDGTLAAGYHATIILSANSIIVEGSVVCAGKILISCAKILNNGLIEPKPIITSQPIFHKVEKYILTNNHVKIDKLLIALNLYQNKITNRYQFWKNIGFELNHTLMSAIIQHPLFLQNTQSMPNCTLLDRLVHELGFVELMKWYTVSHSKFQIVEKYYLFNLFSFTIKIDTRYHAHAVESNQDDEKKQVSVIGHCHFDDSNYRLIDLNEIQPNIMFNYSDTINILSDQSCKIQIKSNQLFNDNYIDFQELQTVQHFESSPAFIDNLCNEDDTIKLRNIDNIPSALHPEVCKFEFMIQGKKDDIFIFDTIKQFEIPLNANLITQDLFARPVNSLNWIKIKSFQTNLLRLPRYIVSDPLFIESTLNVEKSDINKNGMIQIYSNSTIIIDKHAEINNIYGKKRRTKKRPFRGLILLYSDNDIIINGTINSYGGSIVLISPRNIINNGQILSGKTGKVFVCCQAFQNSDENLFNGEVTPIITNDNIDDKTIPILLKNNNIHIPRIPWHLNENNIHQIPLTIYKYSGHSTDINYHPNNLLDNSNKTCYRSRDGISTGNYIIFHLENRAKPYIIKIMNGGGNHGIQSISLSMAYDQNDDEWYSLCTDITNISQGDIWNPYEQEFVIGNNLLLSNAFLVTEQLNLMKIQIETNHGSGKFSLFYKFEVFGVSFPA